MPVVRIPDSLDESLQQAVHADLRGRRKTELRVRFALREFIEQHGVTLIEGSDQEPKSGRRKRSA